MSERTEVGYLVYCTRCADSDLEDLEVNPHCVPKDTEHYLVEYLKDENRALEERNDKLSAICQTLYGNFMKNFLEFRKNM